MSENMTPTAQALAAEIELIRRFVEPLAEQSGYGYYRPENPHDFSPDPELCTEEEIAAHKAACDAYDRGEYKHERVGGWSDDGSVHLLVAPWGIGGYTARDKDAEAILESLPHLTRVLAAADALAEAIKTHGDAVSGYDLATEMFGEDDDCKEMRSARKEAIAAAKRLRAALARYKEARDGK